MSSTALRWYVCASMVILAAGAGCNSTKATPGVPASSFGDGGHIGAGGGVPTTDAGIEPVALPPDFFEMVSGSSPYVIVGRVTSIRKDAFTSEGDMGGYHWVHHFDEALFTPESSIDEGGVLSAVGPRFVLLTNRCEAYRDGQLDPTKRSSLCDQAGPANSVAVGERVMAFGYPASGPKPATLRLRLSVDAADRVAMAYAGEQGHQVLSEVLARVRSYRASRADGANGGGASR